MGAYSGIFVLLRGGDEAGATRATLDAHGPEVFGFLLGVTGDAAVARATYAALEQRVRAELAAFDWNSTLRVWLYGLARRELADRRRRRPRATSSETGDSEPADSEPSVKASHRRPRAPRVLSRLRRALTEEEREILILCVDRKMDGRDIARTALGSGVDAGQLQAEADRVRALVSALRTRLENEAIKERLIPPRPTR